MKVFTSMVGRPFLILSLPPYWHSPLDQLLSILNNWTLQNYLLVPSTHFELTPITLRATYLLRFFLPFQNIFLFFSFYLDYVHILFLSFLISWLHGNICSFSSPFPLPLKHILDLEKENNNFRASRNLKKLRSSVVLVPAEEHQLDQKDSLHASHYAVDQRYHHLCSSSPRYFPSSHELEQILTVNNNEILIKTHTKKKGKKEWTKLHDLDSELV